MSGPSWLVDKSRIATKIKSASTDGELVIFESNPSRACPSCHYVIDNTDVKQEWPGLPRGVKFDPSDEEIIRHLLTKVGAGNLKPHPFIDAFIPTVNEDYGICYTHPRKLPGVKQDGSVSHFFHRAIKAYNTGTRKRRKIQDGNFGDVRWHKTGRTKPVTFDGVQRGCKKIMVLYVSPARGGKAEKTNWVMHQYHLGAQEDEREGDYVVSKVFYQQQQLAKHNDKNEQGEVLDDLDAVVTTKIDPVTPKSIPPEVSRTGKRDLSSDAVYKSIGPVAQDLDVGFMQDDMFSTLEVPDVHDYMVSGHSELTTSGNYGEQVPNVQNHMISDNNLSEFDVLDDHGGLVHDVQGNMIVDNNSQELIASENHSDNAGDKNDYDVGEDSQWFDSEPQHLLDSEELVEALSLCDEFLASQSPKRDSINKDTNQQQIKSKPKLSDYVHLGTKQFKEDLEKCQHLVSASQSPKRDSINKDKNQQHIKSKPKLSDNAHLGTKQFKEDLEKCQHLVSDPANIDVDSFPEGSLSQLEFASEDSYIAWGGSKVGCDNTNYQSGDSFSAETSLHAQG